MQNASTKSLVTKINSLDQEYEQPEPRKFYLAGSQKMPMAPFPDVPRKKSHSPMTRVTNQFQTMNLDTGCSKFDQEVARV